MALSLVSAPATEPLSLDDAKAHLRLELTDTNEDALIAGWIVAARQLCETFTHRAFVTQTWDLKLDGFPCSIGYVGNYWNEPIEIPKPPLQNGASTAPVVTYVDTNGVTQTWSSALYQVDAPAGDQASIGRILPAYQQIYPVTRWQMNAVTVRFVAGYGAANAVPLAIKSAMLLLIGNWWLNREAGQIVRGSSDVLPFGVDQLLWPFKAF